MGGEGDLGEGIAQAFFDQPDGQMGDVDADPLAAQLLGGVDGGAAAAERVEHHVAGVGRGGEDAFEQGDGFLGGVAEAFLGFGGKRPNVGPGVAHDAVFHVMKMAFQAVAFFFRGNGPVPGVVEGLDLGRAFVARGSSEQHVAEAFELNGGSR
jgi:hypothetical protein